MGYTHYWRSKGLTESEWESLVIHTERIIEASPVSVAEEFDSPDHPPLIMEDMIRLNGIGDDGCETFLLKKGPTDFSFCKTHSRPYDEIVVAILIAAESVCKEFSWSSDGEEAEHQQGRSLFESCLETLTPTTE